MMKKWMRVLVVFNKLGDDPVEKWKRKKRFTIEQRGVLLC
jgi:hypothetical protein